ncbi:MAG TPA: hypothetical protein P5267_02745 [Patescibacteria group bacterium]|nr:hypothetical protein [Patescibacteria group bacterium]
MNAIKMKKYFLFLLFIFCFLPVMVHAGYLQEQGQYLENFKVASGETSSFEMFISLIKISLAGAGLMLLVIMLYAGLHWIFTYGDQKTIHDSGMIFWGAVGAFIGVAFMYVVLDFVFRILLLNKT